MRDVELFVEYCQGKTIYTDAYWLDDWLDARLKEFMLVRY